MQPAQRIEALPPYLFSEVDRKKRRAIAAGRDVIDFGVGDPDRPTPDFILERMAAALRNPANHRYPQGSGATAFRQTLAGFFAKRYGVTLDPDRELLALIGSKEGLGHLPLAVLNPGQFALIPSPGYPVYRAATIFAGGHPHVFELRADRGWLPDLAALEADVPPDTALMFLNYPNNPTGAVATREFFAAAVDFARRRNLVLAHDAAYNDLYLGDQPPPSVLEIPGAREVVVEFHSASKTFNMTGWRVGFAAGNADVIAALARIKTNLDSGVFTAVQEAAAEAYASYDRPEVREMRALYRERAEMMCAALREIGFDAEPPRATFYLWARVPGGRGSMAVCDRLLEEADVVGVPGAGFGPSCDGYMRFSLSVPTERIQAAVERMRSLKW